MCSSWTARPAESEVQCSAGIWAQVTEGEHAGLRGKSTVRGHAEMSKEPGQVNRQYITFEGVEIRPAEPQLRQAWLAAFQEANPGMVYTLPLCGSPVSGAPVVSFCGDGPPSGSAA
jgi:hypothetical protein